MTEPRTGTLAAFSSRDFRLLWGGQTISFVGDAAFIVALGWRVTDLTGKASSLGFVLALESLAMLTTLLWGGVLADRYSRRLLMIASDLARAAVMLVFFAIDATGHLSLGSVFALAVCFGLADGFFQPAFGGIVPLVVEQPILPSANSWIGIARQGSAIVGPAIAATLYGTAGPTVVWGIDSASFLVSAGALWLARPRAIQPGVQLGMRKELAAGFRYVISVPWIWTGIAAATVILMIAMSPFTALLPRVVQSHYHRGVGSYGLLFSAMAAGMVAGSLIWARWHPRKRRVAICFAAFGINDLGIVVVALSPWYPLAVLAVAWRGSVDRDRHRRVADADHRARPGAPALPRHELRLLRLARAHARRLRARGRRGDDGRADDDPGGRRRTRRDPLVRPARLGVESRESSAPCHRRPQRGSGARGGNTVSPAQYRGAEIRTPDLSDPNGARYQAAPHPETPDRLALGEELQRSPRADLRPLADQQVTAVGDHPERRVQAAGVLETVLERHLPVAGAPEDEHGAVHALEVAARVVGGERQAGADRIRVHERPAQEPVHRALGEQVRVRHLERPEDDAPQQARACDAVDAPAGDPPRLDEAEEGDRQLGAAGRAGDPGGGGDHEPPHERRMALGEPQGDHTAERVAEHVDRAVEERHEGVGEPAERRRRGQRRRAAVARQVRDDQSASPAGAAAAR